MNNSSHTDQDTMNNSSRDSQSDINKPEIIIDILILCVGLPAICLAIYGLYCMVRSSMVGPIYIINLLIVDILQIMRYLVVAYPLWYWYRRSIRRAIASATSIKDMEKRRILHMLAFVLVTYTVLFLPIIINIFIVCVGLPVNCLAICGLYRLIRSDMVVPIYIINLLIADLLQVVSRPLYIASDYENISEVLLFFGVSASVWFMVCIALERYLVVAHPLWYRYRRSVRHAALISAGVWLLALLLTVPIMLRFFWNFDPFTARLISIPNVFLLPFPLLVFFYLSTRRVIIRTHSIQDKEKKRILCMLALVLGMYTVLFLPFGIMRFIRISASLRRCVLSVKPELIG
ncbi:G-protein coupled receptor 4-like [Amia ocellicauda]|uniref:G-protein coupled receptor 4-like n=1 Tax=Amia ocellicauda TaxID=2972642 RepID=UPI0034649EAA